MTPRRWRTTTAVAVCLAFGLLFWALLTLAVWFALAHPAPNGWALVVLGLGAGGAGLWWVLRPVDGGGPR